MDESRSTVKIIYIAGKITGIENISKEEFERVENIIIKKGHEAVNPHKIPGNEVEGEHWSYYMKKCIRRLMICDKVIPLSNWDKSRGACVELFLCKMLRIEIIDEKFKPMDLSLLSIFFTLGLNLLLEFKKEEKDDKEQ